MEESSWNIMPEKMDKSYANHWELMEDFISLLDMRLYYLYKYHMWVGPENNLQNMMGLAVSRAEFEMNLTRAVDSVVGTNLQNEEVADIEALSAYFGRRLKRTETEHPELPVLQLIRKFRLDDFSANCLLLAFAVQIEKKYEKLFAFLQDDITKKIPTAETAIQLFAIPGGLAADYYRYFDRNSPLVRFFLDTSGEESSLFSIRLLLRSGIAGYLLGNESRYGNGAMELFNEKNTLQPLTIDEFTARRIDSAILQSGPAERLSEGRGDIVLAFISGRRGSGRRFQVRHAVRRKGSKCLFVNMKNLFEAPGTLEEKVSDAVCEAVLSSAYLCFCEFDILLPEENQKSLYQFMTALAQNSAYLSGTVFITAEKEWKDNNIPHGFIKMDIEIAPADENTRLCLWEEFTKGLKLSDDIDLPELASKFRFTPGQIRNAVTQAAGLCEVYGSEQIDTATLHKCCYEQVVMRLDALATRVKPAYGWDDLVLPKDQVELLQEACTHVKYRHTVFQQWGFDRRVSYGKGLSMLFSGPPGTGKTMAAQVIANQLHMEMYKIQLSQVVSKYIGETEKNLRQVFEEAKNSNCILFFDETDALFGKRSEVKDSHDRHANIETAYLLQQMEEYDGVIVMATNLLQNIDAAFMRRINFVIAFPFPDVPTRRLLWEKMLGSGAPVSEDVDLDFLAGQFKIAGGNIKNIVLHAAFLAAAQKSPISMVHLLKSTVNEQRKSNIIVVREDLKEYADLIF